MKRSIIFLLITVSLVSFCQRKGPAGAVANERLRIEVSVDKLRPKPGEIIQLSAIVKTDDSIDDVNLRAKILVPTKRPQDLPLTLASRELGLFKGEVRVEADAPQGFDGITVASEDSSRAGRTRPFFLIDLASKLGYYLNLF
jgi:hypothetical protein